MDMDEKRGSGHLKKYEELSEGLKEVAREFQPDDYEEWFYHVQGVEIPWCCR
jgi:hypothetical protein